MLAAFLTLLGVLFWPLPAAACSPVVPMILLFSGPAFWISGSALGLLLAVALIGALVAIPARLQHPQFLLPGGVF